jgi:hypothetical protein
MSVLHDAANEPIVGPAFRIPYGPDDIAHRASGPGRQIHGDRGGSAERGTDGQVVACGLRPVLETAFAATEAGRRAIAGALDCSGRRALGGLADAGPCHAAEHRERFAPDERSALPREPDAGGEAARGVQDWV